MARSPYWKAPSPRQVAEWAAMFDVVSNDPRIASASYPINSMAFGEAELFATYFLGFSLMHPDSPYVQGLQSELTCLDALLGAGTATDADVWRRIGILGALGMLVGVDRFAPDHGGGGGDSREVLFPTKQHFEQARNQALELLGEINPRTRSPVVARLPASSARGQIVGFETEAGGVWKRFRLDYDPVKRAHINVEMGKGLTAKRYVIPWEGTEQDFLNQVKRLQ